jgi:hypothetical protein
MMSRDIITLMLIDIKVGFGPASLLSTSSKPTTNT